MELSLDKIKDVLKEVKCHSTIDYKAELNEQQYEAAMIVDGPALVIAGAGSGKTRMVSYRVANLIERGVSPETILLLTFTNKAAKEMIGRSVRLLDERCNNIAGGTYHSFSVKLLRKYGRKIGISPNFTIADQSDATDIIGRVIASYPKEDLKYFPKKDTMSSIFSTSINKCMSLEELVKKEYPTFTDSIGLIEDCMIKYKELKLRKNILDYDDMIVRLCELLESDKDLAMNLSNMYQYIIVDEYQDSNILQFRLLKALCSAHENLMVVGDEQQSIYMWRGADYKNILNFPNIFKNTKIVVLYQNYRSTQAILDFSNVIIKNAKYKFDKELKSMNIVGEKPYLVEVESSHEETLFVLQRINELIQEGKSLNEISVLVRNAYLSSELEMYLNKLNIPYVKMGGLKLTEKSHVKDILSYMRILQNHSDELGWLRVLEMLQNIGPKNAQKIMDKVETKGLDGLLDGSFKKRIYFSQLEGLYGTLKKTLNLDFADQINFIYRSFYLDYMKIAYKDDYAQRQEDLEILIEIASRYKNVEDFLTDLILDPQLSATSSQQIANEECLTISTIHSAKGLEWDEVFILSFVDGVLPSSKAFSDIEQLEEERRLFYVAATRAGKNLYLMKPQYLKRFGSVTNMETSRFLEEDDMNSVYQMVKCN